MRLFVALPVPEAVEGEIASLQRRLARELPEIGFRWQPPEAAHLTLVFLGTVDESALPYCRRALAAAAERHGSIGLGSTSLGAFPSAARASVVWLGVEAAAGSGALAALQTDLAQRMSVLKRGHDPEAFRPHLTLGRVRNGGRHGGALGAALTRISPQRHSWTARELVLYRSRTSREGSRYQALAREALRGPAHRSDTVS